MAETFGKDRFWNRGPVLDLKRYVHFRAEFWKTDISATALPAPWTLTDTSSGGTPTIVQSGDAHGGAIEMKHASTSEAEVIGIDFGDELLFDIDKLMSFQCRFRMPTISAVDELIVGMISNHNDTIASLTEGAWISVDGAQNIDCESDDGTNRNDDDDSDEDLGNDVWCWVAIDFRKLRDVKFYLDVLGNGELIRVLEGDPTFDLSNYSSGLQPSIFLIKDSGATQINVDVDVVDIVARR